MAIEIKKRPFYYCFSGNPVHYELYSLIASQDPSIAFEVVVCFQPAVGPLVQTEAFEYTPVDGVADVDIRDILEGFLQYELPQFTGPSNAYWTAPGQTGYFWIRMREISTLSPAPTWDDSEADFQCFAVKGGISRFRYQGNNFFANYFNADEAQWPRPFFTWQQSGRKAALTERIYLAFLLIQEVAQGELKWRCDCVYTDGTGTSERINLTSQKNMVYYLPAGAAQWNLDTSKRIWYWELQLINDHPVSPDILSVPFRFYADNRKDYNDVTLHYRNSLGGLDSVRVRGVIEQGLEYEFEEVQKTVAPDYYDGHYYDAQRTITHNREVIAWRGDIGHLDKEEQDRLRDAFVVRETWKEVQRKWWPVSIMTKSLKQKTSEDNRWTMPIDFQLAHEGDGKYTPDTVDLGEGSYTSNVCRAYLGDIAVAVSAGTGGNQNISITFTEVDPDDASTQIRWRVVRRFDTSFVVHDWTTEDFVSPLQFTLPANNEYLFEVRAVCANNINGRVSQAVVDTTAANVGGPATGNGKITNYTNTGTDFEVSVNGTVVGSGFVGANSSAYYNIPTPPNLVNVTVVLVLASLTPSLVNFYGRLSFLPFPGTINGNTITFDGQDIDDSSRINIS